MQHIKGHTVANDLEQDARAEAFAARIAEMRPDIRKAQEERASPRTGAAWLAIKPTLPRDWKMVLELADGAMYTNKRLGLKVIMSVSVEEDDKLWVHASSSRRSKLPTYKDLCVVKNLFIGKELKAIQVFAPEKEHVNINPNVLHLWACFDGDGLPDFTSGTGSI